MNQLKKKIIISVLLVCTVVFLSSQNNAYALSTSKLADYYLFNNTNNQALDYCNHTSSPDCLAANRIAMSVSNNCQLPGIIDQSCGYYRNGMGGTFINNLVWLTDNSTSYTINTWVNLNGTGGGGAGNFLLTTTGQAITGDIDITVPNNAGSNKNVVWTLRSNTNSFTINTPVNSMKYNQWYMLTFTLDSTPNTRNNFKIYVNGTLSVKGNVTGLDGLASQADLGFGACCVDSGPVWNQPLAGRADELSLWKRALTPSEITTLYNSGNGYSLLPGNATPSFTNSVSPIVSSTNIVLPVGYVTNNNGGGTCLNQELLTFNNSLKQTATFTPAFCFTDGQYTVPYTFSQSNLGNGTYRVIPSFNGAVNCLNGNSCISSVVIGFGNGGGVFIGNSTNQNNATNKIVGSIAYNFYRTPDYSQLVGAVFITPQPFDLSCQVVNGTFQQYTKWFSFHQVKLANLTANVPKTDNAYFACFKNSNNTLVLSGRSPGMQSGIVTGALTANSSIGALIGVPISTFGLLLLASLANTRTGPIYVVIILGVAGIMGIIGLLTLDPKVWGAMIVAGFLGLFVGRKLF